MREVESRAGVESLDALHAERRALVKRISKLAALYEDWRKAEARRKVVLAFCDLDVRAKSEKRLTDKHYDSLARTHARYTNHLNDDDAGREELRILEHEEECVSDRIRSRETEMHFVRAEMGLAR
mgnify:CR=1 FL=1